MLGKSKLLSHTVSAKFVLNDVEFCSQTPILTYLERYEKREGGIFASFITTV